MVSIVKAPGDGRDVIVTGNTGEALQAAIDRARSYENGARVVIPPGDLVLTETVDCYPSVALTIEWMRGARVLANFTGADAVALKATNPSSPSTRGRRLALVNPYVGVHGDLSASAIGPVLFEHRYATGLKFIGDGYWTHYLNNTAIRVSGLYNTDWGPTSVWGAGHFKPWKDTTGVTFSITSGGTTLSASGSIFAAGDVGKRITLQGSNGKSSFVISSYTNATTVETTETATITFSGSIGHFQGVTGSISSSGNTLTMDADCLVASDEGRAVVIPGAISSAGTKRALRATISSVDSGTQATLSATASAAVSNGEVIFSPAVDIFSEDTSANYTNDFSTKDLHIEQHRGCGLFVDFSTYVSFDTVKIHANNNIANSANQSSFNALFGSVSGIVWGDFEGTGVERCRLLAQGGLAGLHFPYWTGIGVNDQPLVVAEEGASYANVSVGAVSLVNGGISARTQQAMFSGVDYVAGPVSTYNVDNPYGGQQVPQIVLGPYTVAGAPSDAIDGAVAYFSNGDAGSPCLAMWDGSNWKVIAQIGATIAAA